MVTISTLDYATYLRDEKPLVAPNVQFAFPYRTMKLGDRFERRYRSIINQDIGRTPLQDARVAMMNKRYEYQRDCVLQNVWTGRYYDIFPGVHVDHIDTLECLGATASSRRDQGVYTLINYLPEMLAFITSESPELIRTRLESNCNSCGVSLYDVSTAVCFCDQEMLKAVPVAIFKGLSTSLDIALKHIVRVSPVIKAGLDTIDLARESPESRIITFILYHVAVLQQQIFNAIIQDHMDDRESDQRPYLTSKGVGTLTFQMYSIDGLPPVEVRLGTQSPFVVKPCIMGKRMFTLMYAKESL